MSVQAVLLPVFVQAALTFVLMVWMARARFAAVRTKQVSLNDLRSSWTNWPSRPTQIAAAYHNQFELPVLFYAIVLIALVTTLADLLFVILSWLFVIARIVHAFVHTGRNEIGPRFRVFAVGSVILIVMWLHILLKLYLGF